MICPKCNKEIEYLDVEIICHFSTIMTKDMPIDYIEEELFTAENCKDSADYYFQCPECSDDLFIQTDEAIKFITG